MVMLPRHPQRHLLHHQEARRQQVKYLTKGSLLQSLIPARLSVHDARLFLFRRGPFSLALHGCSAVAAAAAAAGGSSSAAAAAAASVASSGLCHDAPLPLQHCAVLPAQGSPPASACTSCACRLHHAALRASSVTEATRADMPVCMPQVAQERLLQQVRGPKNLHCSWCPSQNCRESCTEPCQQSQPG